MAEASALNINMDDFKMWSLGTPIVAYTDMEAEMKLEAIDSITGALEKSQSGGQLNGEAACKIVKEFMDRQYGPCWHCICGEGYSFEVTRQAGCTINLYYAGKYNILLFKC